MTAGSSDASTVASGRTLLLDFNVESRMSKMEENMTSQKDDISQIKKMIQVLINNKGHLNQVSSPPGTLNLPDLSGGGGGVVWTLGDQTIGGG